MTGWTARATTVTRPLVGAVTAHMVTAEWAARVVSPLHDVLTDAERRAILAENPDSYLHVTSDPLALPEPPGDAAAESVQARALRRLLDIGAYSPVPEPALFVYRLSDRGREHTGVIASVTVAGFGDGRVLGHEDVQPDRVAGLVRHYRQVPMRSELVALVHPADPMVAELTARVVTQPPLLAFTDAGGVAQSVWQAGTAEATALARQLGDQRHYVADGHHRVAAATRCWEQAGRPESGAVLCALYPQDAVRPARLPPPRPRAGRAAGATRGAGQALRRRARQRTRRRTRPRAPVSPGRDRPVRRRQLASAPAP